MTLPWAGGFIQSSLAHRAGTTFGVIVHGPASPRTHTPVELDESGHPEDGVVTHVVPSMGGIQLHAPEAPLENPIVALIDSGDPDTTRRPFLVDIDPAGVGECRSVVGKRFEARWSRDGKPWALTFEGPKSRGDVVRVELVGEEAAPEMSNSPLTVEAKSSALRTTFTGRVVDVDGNPLASRRVKIRAGSSGHQWSTDAKGAFRFPSGHLDSASQPAEVTVDVTDPRRGDFGRAPMPGIVDGGETALGDIVVTPYDLLVSGGVVDPNGQPVPRARISVATESVDAPWAFRRRCRLHRRDFRGGPDHRAVRAERRVRRRERDQRIRWALTIVPTDRLLLKIDREPRREVRSQSDRIPVPCLEVPGLASRCTHKRTPCRDRGKVDR